VDEAYLLPRPDIKRFEEVALCALRIKDEIKRQERITCLVGVGQNKLIAKIASKFRKPDGLTVVTMRMLKSSFILKMSQKYLL
jgi:DNA polymerase IV (DinB-like DNA polymerase)